MSTRPVSANPFSRTANGLRRLAAWSSLCLVAATLSLGAIAADPRPQIFPMLEFRTTEGIFYVQLDGRRAPLTVKNFMAYVKDGHYDGTIFHRVIPGFMAQGGGYDVDLTEKPTRDPVVNESGNGLSNRRGTIAMARTNDPHSASAQFFINLVDNGRLDPSAQRWGYTVFGEVTDETGLKVLDAIAELETGARGPFRSDVPKKPVIIQSVRAVKAKSP